MADDYFGVNQVRTWHHGLLARWWANFNVDGQEIDFFRPYILSGQPVLDVGCGSGRLLVPWVKSGLDVDGVDASADMISACRDAARAVGCSPALYVQATHLLDIPRQYGAIVMCGTFGLGVAREQDLDGLRRMRRQLRAGGQLALDYEVNEFDFDHWRANGASPADDSPPAKRERRLGADGFSYALRGRVTSLDPDSSCATREMQAWQWKGDDLVAHETHELTTNIYSSAEIVHLLEKAGFVDVRVAGGYHGGEPDGHEEFLVYFATAP